MDNKSTLSVKPMPPQKNWQSVDATACLTMGRPVGCRAELPNRLLRSCNAVTYIDV